MRFEPIILAVPSLAAIMMIAAAILPSLPGDASGTPWSDRATAGQASDAPIVLAQGRCFNGRCY